MTSIVALTEGHADCASLPILLRRIVEEYDLERPIVKPPIRFKRNRIEQEEEINRLMGLARLKLRGAGAILILLDADDDCPAELGPRVQQVAANQTVGIRLAVVIAKRMYETWLVAGAEGLIEHGEIDASPIPENPESMGSPKRWLSQRMHRLGGYGETADMKRLTGRFSIRQARRRAPSFDKLCRELARLLRLGPG